jgi:DNA-binding SARP family transcriptional activator
LRTALLLERLWPGVGHERASASLRTAASEIRTTLRERDCLVRHHESLTLVGAQVDARDLVLSAKEARRARLEGRTADAVECAQRAAALYQDGFHAYDDDAAWAVIERERLRRVHGACLLDGAECALSLSRYQEAHDLAADLVRSDPMDERAHRVLMRSLAELGEMGRALRAFESYRRYLADELGADPSHQTRDLHEWLLRLP